jgi:hypothetical protein
VLCSYFNGEEVEEGLTGDCFREVIYCLREVIYFLDF